MNIELVLNTIMISLLVLTITFCWKLNSKIVMLKNGRKDLDKMVQNFDIAIVKTHQNIEDLKRLTITSGEDLQLRITKAQELSADLGFMIDKAASLADKLEEGIAVARSAAVKLDNNSVEAPKNPANQPVAEKKSHFSKASNELLNAIKNITKAG